MSSDSYVSISDFNWEFKLRLEYSLTDEDCAQVAVSLWSRVTEECAYEVRCCSTKLAATIAELHALIDNKPKAKRATPPGSTDDKMKP